MSGWADYFGAFGNHVQALDRITDAFVKLRKSGRLKADLVGQYSAYLEAVNAMGQNLYIIFNTVRSDGSYAEPQFRTELMARTGMSASQINDALTGYHKAIGAKLASNLGIEPITLTVIAIVAVAVVLSTTIVAIAYTAANKAQLEHAAALQDKMVANPDLAALLAKTQPKPEGFLGEFSGALKVVGAVAGVGLGAWLLIQLWPKKGPARAEGGA